MAKTAHCPEWLGAWVYPHGSRGGYAHLLETDSFSVKILGTGLPHRPRLYVVQRSHFVQMHPQGAKGACEEALCWLQLQGATLRGAALDGKTTLAGAVILAPDDERPLLVRLLRRPRYGPALGDLHWGDFDLVQLTQLDGWEDLRRLADERGLTWRSGSTDHRDAVRAYRQVAQRLRDQGFSDIADRLADRAQVLQRKLLFRLMLENWRRPWRLPGDLLRWLFSWFLAILAGYGYHPGRSVFWYLAVVAGFAVTYFSLGASTGHSLTWNEALVVSLTAFHGRGFFAGTFQPGDPQEAAAAAEAVIGLLIEISFIATFTQRFLGAK